MRLLKSQLNEFLRESNAIEGVYGDAALKDALSAWNYAYKNHARGFSVPYIMHIHLQLMMNLRPDIAGALRTCDVWIGGQCKKYRGVEILRSLLQDWCDKHNGIPIGNLPAMVKQAHIDFEDIHPFEDGNGRVGRILYNIHRITLGLPLHIIHEGDEQMEYYKWFKK